MMADPRYQSLPVIINRNIEQNSRSFQLNSTQNTQRNKYGERFDGITILFVFYNSDSPRILRFHYIIKIQTTTWFHDNNEKQLLIRMHSDPLFDRNPSCCGSTICKRRWYSSSHHSRTLNQSINQSILHTSSNSLGRDSKRPHECAQDCFTVASQETVKQLAVVWDKQWSNSNKTIHSAYHGISLRIENEMVLKKEVLIIYSITTIFLTLNHRFLSIYPSCVENDSVTSVRVNINFSFSSDSFRTKLEEYCPM